jgi:hypothetical protein
MRAVAVGTPVRFLVLVCGILPLIPVAWFAGRTAYLFLRCRDVVPLSCLAGVALAVIAIVHPAKSHTPPRFDRFAGGAITIYVIVASCSGQFAHLQVPGSLEVAIIWLLPLMVGGLFLPCLDCWFTGFSCWAVLFAAITAISYSLDNQFSGVGFFWEWTY